MRKLPICIVSAVMLLILSGCKGKISNPVMPAPLQKGDKVAVIAPGFHLDDSLVMLGCQRLKECGFEPVLGKNALKRYPGVDSLYNYAGTKEERQADLLWALNDEQIKGIICIRGGYGSIHLLSKELVEAFRKHPKWLVGYSDITILHLASVRSGVMSMHGNMCSDFALKGMEDEGNVAVLEALKGNFPQYELPADSLNIPGEASGMLVGGNLSNIAPLLGTEYDCFKDRDCILFLEEVREAMYSADRYLSAILLHHGKRLKGVIIGDFTNCYHEIGFEGGIYGMLHKRLKDLGIPVCFGFHGGHGQLNMPLVEGARVQLKVTGSGASINMALPKQ